MNTLLKIIKHLFNHPYEEFHIREIARRVKISPFAVKKYVDMLLKERLLLESRKGNLRYIKPNMTSLVFRYAKITNNLAAIEKSGLISFLKENLPNLSSVVLFGSLARGEDTPKSDIDILAIGKEKNLNVTPIEEKLGKKITVHILSWSEWNKKGREDAPFYFEIMRDGIPLVGELPLIKWERQRGERKWK